VGRWAMPSDAKQNLAAADGKIVRQRNYDCFEPF
jgi:hypothetical protein